MAPLQPWQLLAVVLCSFCVLARASRVTLGGFSTCTGCTGCISEPTKGCGGSDICYTDRGNAYAISGTSPMCSACMPKNYRNIATYETPQNLPCALWRAYECDDHFVTYVWNKSGSNSCWLGGAKSYNIENTHSSATAAHDEFVRQCRREKSAADYELFGFERITEEKFCFPLYNNITEIRILGDNNELSTVLTDYKEYYENKFGKIVKDATTFT